MDGSGGVSAGNGSSGHSSCGRQKLASMESLWQRIGNEAPMKRFCGGKTGPITTQPRSPPMSNKRPTSPPTAPSTPAATAAAAVASRSIAIEAKDPFTGTTSAAIDSSVAAENESFPATTTTATTNTSTACCLNRRGRWLSGKGTSGREDRLDNSVRSNGDRKRVTTKTMEAERRQRTTAGVGGMGPGVTNPKKTTEGMWWLSMEGNGICGIVS